MVTYRAAPLDIRLPSNTARQRLRFHCGDPIAPSATFDQARRGTDADTSHEKNWNRSDRPRGSERYGTLADSWCAVRRKVEDVYKDMPAPAPHRRTGSKWHDNHTKLECDLLGGTRHRHYLIRRCAAPGRDSLEGYTSSSTAMMWLLRRRFRCPNAANTSTARLTPPSPSSHCWHRCGHGRLRLRRSSRSSLRLTSTASTDHIVSDCCAPALPLCRCSRCPSYQAPARRHLGGRAHQARAMSPSFGFAQVMPPPL